jgi:hypothetical protein
MRFSLDKVGIAVVVLAPVIACATSETVDGNVPDGGDCASGFCEDSAAPSLIPTADGGDAAEPSVRRPPPACVGTTCPAPWATCPGNRFLCETNVENDSENCGACGHACPDVTPVNMVSRCVKGACAFECLTTQDDRGPTEYRDCNHLIDDGCETNITDDPANCGACGHQVNIKDDPMNCGACGNACPAQTICVDGKCGCPDGKCTCPPPLKDCNGQCVDTRSDEYNCGACGNVCRDPANACPNWNPLWVKYTCINGECGKVACRSDTSADCNHDLDKAYTDKDCLGGDGCETNLLNPAANNCGACGVKCLPGEECRDDGDGLRCHGPCVPPLTKCGRHCVDPLGDPNNCGVCGNLCQSVEGGRQVASCTKGFCSFECVAGFADCNGEWADGCEVDLSKDPANCGSCRNACDADAGAGSDGGTGQPCIEGKCLMVDCDAGVTH